MDDLNFLRCILQRKSGSLEWLPLRLFTGLGEDGYRGAVLLILFLFFLRRRPRPRLTAVDAEGFVAGGGRRVDVVAGGAVV